MPIDKKREGLFWIDKSQPVPILFAHNIKAEDL